MTESQKPASRGLRCEAHGLLYDPNQPGGCVLCRREAGQPVQAAAPTPNLASNSHDAMKKALAVTAGLILVTSLGFYSVHTAAVKMLSGVTSNPFRQGLTPEELEKAGVGPRLEKYLDAVQELDEIEANRYVSGGEEDSEQGEDSEDGYDEGY